MKQLNWITVLGLALALTSCGLFGIHFNFHNPKKPGKNPNFSREIILLGAMTHYRDCYDVKFYDLSADFNPDEKTIDGSVQIHAEATRDFDTLQIDLHPNFEIIRLVDRTSKQALPFFREERAVWVVLKQKQGDNFAIEVEYNGKPYKAKKAPWKGGFVWKKDKEKHAWLGVACESDGASLWWPLKDHTADEPDSVNLHYTVPAGLTAVGNGQFRGETKSGDKTTFHWHVSYPINTYNITVYVGKFELLEQQYTGKSGKSMTLSFYVLERNKSLAQKHFKQVYDIMEVYEKLFGDYPWYEDGFKLVESPYAGMEHQTAIAYGNGYKNDLYSVDYIILHEMAHEWWGNSVTARDLADVWIQEGFATYAESLYLEIMEGKSTYDDHLWYNGVMIKNKYPVVNVYDRRYFHFRKGSDVYVKGAWILHSLRDQIQDDDLFFDIIKSFHEKFKYQLVDSDDFIQHVNAKTKKNYQWFFNQYLYDNVIPELEYATSYYGVFHYRWKNVPDNFTRMEVEMQANGETFRLKPSTQTQTFNVPKNKMGSWSYQLPLNSLIIYTENKGLLKGK